MLILKKIRIKSSVCGDLVIGVPALCCLVSEYATAACYPYTRVVSMNSDLSDVKMTCP